MRSLHGFALSIILIGFLSWFLTVNWQDQPYSVEVSMILGGSFIGTGSLILSVLERKKIQTFVSKYVW